MPVAAVEIEVNLKSYNQQTKGGRQRRFNLSWPEKLINVLDLVIATCKELGIAIAAYSYVLLSSSSSPFDSPTVRSIMDYSPTTPRTVYTSKAIPGVRSVFSGMT
jgi:hypothetical protein